ncbi:putative olfactory receptor 14L1 [Phodopus roborovskii]|uniref:Olfr465-ps1 protein n=1 Tax=Phodopus roborovskii TaxID=109678 RepID=A0AAU9ZMG4_PHORO|nr:putative olfactory receptor 14L1 [Phodopus roborovskii]CAH6795419.1 Olfr465-ps1 [Phodopus roborovskii]
MTETLTNVTDYIEFLLMGYPDGQVLQTLCVTLFFLIYLGALVGNFLIITLITIAQHLQTPMYFFLKNLSLIDICYISVTVPKSITNYVTNTHSISFVGCVLQVFFVTFLAGTEFALLLVMSHDRYAAICFPLHYEAIMNRDACVRMVVAAWLSGCIYGSLHATGTFSVHFCGPNVVHQFFCDIPSLLRLTCFGDQILEYVFIIISCCFTFICFILMVISYVHIFTIILRIPSIQGRFKIFSTCIPHLTVVTLFLFSAFVAYLGSTAKFPSSLNLLMSGFYSLLPPSLNPVIYSLRNSDVKMALCNILGDKMPQVSKSSKY